MKTIIAFVSILLMGQSFAHTLLMENASTKSIRVNDSLELVTTQSEEVQFLSINGEFSIDDKNPSEWGLYASALRGIVRGKSVVLNLKSHGGSIQVANRLRSDLKKVCHNKPECTISTVVNEYCDSACVSVFAMGDRRFTKESATFTLHSSFNPQTGFASPSESMIRAVLSEGMDLDFVSTLMKQQGLYSDGRDLILSGREEMEKSGLVTDWIED